MVSTAKPSRAGEAALMLAHAQDAAKEDEKRQAEQAAEVRGLV